MPLMAMLHYRAAALKTADARHDVPARLLRIDRMMLVEVAWPRGERPQIFVCGPTLLVEAAATALVELGHDRALVKIERFGPTGRSS